MCFLLRTRGWKYRIEHLEWLQKGAESKREGAKNIRCIICDTSLTGKAVLAQKKASVGACVPLRKKDDNRSVEFKIVQKDLNKEMMAKARLLSCSQAKKSVVDSTMYLGKRIVSGEMKLIYTRLYYCMLPSRKWVCFQCCWFT